MTSSRQEPGRGERRRLTRAQVWLFAAGCAVLVAGSAGSVWAYRSAAPDDLADSLVAGAYNTKKAQDELERYGGKANILATEAQQWFAGLWHGRHLACTLAVLTVVAALATFYIALFLPDFPPPDVGAARDKEAPER